MTESSTTFDFDYFVIGGGSGGVSSAKRAASHGAKVGAVERGRLGGTCVNVGCVPKKVMWSAATIADTLSHDAHHYGFSGGRDVKRSLDWPKLKAARDAYVARLNGIYEKGYRSAGVKDLRGVATLGSDGHTIQISSSDGKRRKVTARHILIATGGTPIFPPGEGIEEHSISSDGFFDLDELPRVAVVVGAGYIAIELAGVLNSLGTHVHLVLRKNKALRKFDSIISDSLDEEMLKAGIQIHRNTGGVDKVVMDDNGNKTVTTKTGETISGANVVLMATGRSANTGELGLDEVGVKLNDGGHIQVDEYSNTTAENIYALGDVCGQVELTPMAIAAGRRLADRLFGGEKYRGARVSYENVPTVVFAHPPIATCGLTEDEAVDKYGDENLHVYTAKFADSHYGVFDVDPDDKPKTAVKLICAGTEERVIGIHVIGRGADEMMQGFGIAMKMGATKADFESCIAIHPTASEELVTMGVWGTSPQISGAKHSPLNGAPPSEPTLNSSKM